MGVYIKGKRKPDTCYDCDFVDGSDDCFFGLGYTGDMCDCVYEDCPLIEVKTPHGRLIDADAEYKALSEMKVEGEVFVTAVEFAKIEMEQVQTIIEAEVE